MLAVLRRPISTVYPGQTLRSRLGLELDRYAGGPRDLSTARLWRDQSCPTETLIPRQPRSAGGNGRSGPTRPPC